MLGIGAIRTLLVVRLCDLMGIIRLWVEFMRIRRTR